MKNLEIESDVIMGDKLIIGKGFVKNSMIFSINMKYFVLLSKKSVTFLIEQLVKLKTEKFNNNPFFNDMLGDGDYLRLRNSKTNDMFIISINDDLEMFVSKIHIDKIVSYLKGA